MTGRYPVQGQEAVATPQCSTTSPLTPRRTRECLRRASRKTYCFLNGFPSFSQNGKGPLWFLWGSCHTHHGTRSTAAVSMLWQHLSLRAIRSSKQGTTEAVKRRLPFAGSRILLIFHRFLKVFEEALPRPGSPPRAAPGRTPGTGRISPEPIVFARFFNGFHGFRSRSRDVALGRSAGTWFAGNRILLVFQRF